MKKENFLDYLFDINPLPEELKNGKVRKQIGEFFNERVLTSTYNHGIYLHTAGSVCDKIFFIEDGVLRGFIVDRKKNKEHTIFLWDSKSLATDAGSLLFKRPSEIYIQVLSDAKVAHITYYELVGLIRQYPFMESFLGTLMDSEQAFSNKRFNIFGLTAKEKYDELRKSFPQIELTVPKGHLASYLGISRQHFHRLTKDY